MGEHSSQSSTAWTMPDWREQKLPDLMEQKVPIKIKSRLTEEPVSAF